MRLLLDSHAILWWLDENGPLALPVRDMIDDVGNVVAVSVATVWELGIKSAAGRLRMPDDMIELLGAQEVDLLEVGAVEALAAAALPRHHGDPFDRVLVAQAELGDDAVVTADRRFAAYGVATVAAR